MGYLEGIDRLKSIEQSYDVMSIKFKDIPVWPFLRIYLFQHLGGTNNLTAHDISFSKIWIVLRALFAYNPFQLFKEHRYWLYTASERRKQIDGKNILRVSGFISDINNKSLIIEKPSLHSPHFKKESIPEKCIISESLQIFGGHLIERFLRFLPLRIENEDIISNILKEQKIKFDYKYFIRFLFSQKLITDIFLKISKKPEKVLIECPYNIMGYVWSFHNHGVEVIELQHGVLGSSHYAYILNHNTILSPDQIWVYGRREFDFFKKENPFYSKKVSEMGMYFLEYANKAFSVDIFAVYRKQYNKIIVIAGQNAVEKPLHKFINQISELNKDYLFVYIPRYADEKFNIAKTNVLLAAGVNIYQYLKWCDIHVTVSSTTCLEATYFDKPTIFFDYNDLASNYYGEYLSDGVSYIKSPLEFRCSVDDFFQNKPKIRKDVFHPFVIDEIKRMLNEIN